MNKKVISTFFLDAGTSMTDVHMNIKDVVYVSGILITLLTAWFKLKHDNDKQTDKIKDLDKRAEKYFNLLLAKEKRENRQLTKKQFCSQLCFLGLIYQFQNKNELAEPTFIKARNLGSGEAASMLATMYFSQGKNDLAEEHIKIASELMAAQERE